MNCKALLPPALILAGALVSSAQPPPGQGGKPVPPGVGTERRLPDLVVTHFAATGPVFTRPNSRGYVFLPVEFTVTNVGAAVAAPFQINAHCNLGNIAVRPAGVMEFTVTQNTVGGGSIAYSTLLPPGAPPSTTSFAPVTDPLPGFGGKANVTTTLAVPVGSYRGRVVLWVVADEANVVAESNETNNKSAVITVLVR